MGVFTQNIQQLERSLTNEQKKRAFKKEKIRELELFLYNKFYNKFYENKKQNPVFLLGYFQNPDIKKRLLNYNGFLDDIEKSKIYNNILNNIYKDFKKYYTLEIDTTKENIKQQKEEEQKQKELEKLKKEYFKQLEKNQKLKKKQKETYNKATDFSINSILIGSIIAGKTHKNKYKL